MKTKIIPFNIEKAKSGAKIVTRDNYPVRILCYDLEDSRMPIIAAVRKDRKEIPYQYTIEGNFYPNKEEDTGDLFIEEEEKEEEEVDNYNPYRETVKSISDMIERYSDANSDLQDFYDNVKVKCKEAVEYDKKWCKKQEEQKTLDEFKIMSNKWYVCTHYISSDDADIWFKKDSKYLGTDILKSNLDLHKDDDYKNYFRPWGIKDAKPGDVLHSTGLHNNNNCIFIFNGLDNWKFDADGDRAVATGCCCLFVTADKIEFGIQGPDCIEVNTTTPATQAQRDLLFQKIKEEGYEWDSDKKELKKIVPKFKVGDVMRTLEEADDDITEGLPVVISIGDDYYHCYNETIAIKDQDEYEYPPMNAKQIEVKTRKMTNQELSWWLRDCQQERREVCRVDEDTIYSRYIYRKCDANEEVDHDIRIRKNGGEWQEPLIEE